MFLSLCTAYEVTDVLACISVFISFLPGMQPALELATILQLDCEVIVDCDPQSLDCDCNPRPWHLSVWFMILFLECCH